MVSDAAATKAPIAKIADRVSGIFVPAVITIAIVTTIIWLLTGHEFGYALARGISVLMANTGLDVYVLDAAANALAGLSGVIFAPMSFLVYFGLSFLIPSTSGMATVSMPIMGPLAVKLGFSPEVMVMIFSAAIGVVNLFTPTSGAIMGGLALAKIEWTTWLKFALKLIVALSVVCAVILTIACVML